MTKVTTGRTSAIVRMLGPMSQLLTLVQDCLVAHHPVGATADDCDVCSAYNPALRQAIEQVDAATVALAQEWDFTLDG